MHIVPTDAHAFLLGLPEKSVDLLLTDPPFFGIVEEKWDRQWRTPEEFVDWLSNIFQVARWCLKDTGSLVFFGGIGKHGVHPLLDLIRRLEGLYTYRNWITWQTRQNPDAKDKRLDPWAI